MSDPIDIAEGYSAEPYGDGYIICHSGGGRAVAQLDMAAAVREIARLRRINSALVDKANALTIQSARDAEEITRLRAALAAQVPQPVAWLCEWIDPEDQSITWHQYHDASDPMPDKWDDPPQRVTPLAAAPGASPPAALAVPDGTVESLAHRIAWRYKKSSDPAHSDTYTFNRATLLHFAQAIAAFPQPTQGQEG